MADNYYHAKINFIMCYNIHFVLLWNPSSTQLVVISLKLLRHRFSVAPVTEIRGTEHNNSKLLITQPFSFSSRILSKSLSFYFGAFVIFTGTAKLSFRRKIRLRKTRKWTVSLRRTKKVNEYNYSALFQLWLHSASHIHLATSFNPTDLRHKFPWGHTMPEENKSLYARVIHTQST